MIPALLAAPFVQGVVGGVVGTVANAFSPSAPPPSLTSDSSSDFGPLLNRASAAGASPAVSGPVASATGSMHAADWSAMSGADLNSWAQSLAGKHVDASDNAGRTISGTVDGVQNLGGTLALNIGGHLVSLSQLKQISWSPSVA